MTTIRETERRAMLAREVYEAVLDGTESFEGIGEPLAYLMGAILKGPAANNNSIDVIATNSTDVQLVYILRNKWPDPDMPIWDYVAFMDQDRNNHLPAKVWKAIVKRRSLDNPDVKVWHAALKEINQ